MKKVTLALGLILVFALGSFAQSTSPAAGGPEISFQKDVHDFGKVKQHGNATTEFKFTNTGSAPLIISNAKGSCGCTVPTWPREPIAPGKSATIKVKYDSKRVGPINKSVSITSNAVGTPTKVIRITGEISAAPKAATTPVNKTGSAPTTL
ncbi:MAG: hypothetical protein ACI85Q_001693 [Salibacteraceae bacterium]|jgi:hypothetical protein